MLPTCFELSPMAWADKLVMIGLPGHTAPQVGTDGGKNMELPIFGAADVNRLRRNHIAPTVALSEGDGLPHWLFAVSELAQFSYIRPSAAGSFA